MTNKFYNKTATLSVYIANLDEYVKGNLIVNWISLPIKKKDFRDFLFTIGNPEKVKILDYIDNLGLNGLKIEKYKSLKELNQLAKRMKNIDTSEVNTFNALYEALGNFETALDYLKSDYYTFYKNMTMEEVAKERIAYLEKYFKIPSFLEKQSELVNDMRAKGYYETAYGVIYVA